VIKLWKIIHNRQHAWIKIQTAGIWREDLMIRDPVIDKSEYQTVLLKES
jgi:hypothetical protein